MSEAGLDPRDALAVKLLIFLSDDDTEAVLDLLEHEGWAPPPEPVEVDR